MKKNYLQKIHKSSTRDPLKRMIDNKISCMTTARKFGKDFWDGERKFGYGGYKYIEGYWAPVAKKMIKDYSLNNNSKILDIGCGKGFLLYEFKKLLPGISIFGYDISKYAITHAKTEIKHNLFVHPAEKKTKFNKNFFDLAFSLATFHNLHLKDLIFSLKEIKRISKKSYIMVESYRNNKELFNLQCWALTCNAYFNDEDWMEVFKISNFDRDYEFIYF